MQAPRAYHYQYVFRILADDAHRGDTWPVVTGSQAGAYFAMKWAMAGGDPALTPQIRFAGHTQLPGWELLIVGMPEPIAATEAHYVAYARPLAGGPLRFFVMEKGLQDVGQPPRAYVSEKRADGMRIRHGDLPGLDVTHFIGHLMQELSAARAIPEAESIPFHVPTMPPVAMHAYPPAPKKGGAGKWIALGVVGFFSLATVFGLIRHKQKEDEWAAREKRREDAENEAKDALKSAKKNAHEKLDAVIRPYDTCVAGEKAFTKTALDRARASNALGGTLKRPQGSNQRNIDGAFPVSSGAAPASMDWLPTTPWINQASSSCGALPAAVAELKAELALPDPDAYSPTSMRQRTDKLEELASKLGAPGASSHKMQAIVVADIECTGMSVASYIGTYAVDLERYECKAKLVWINGAGEVLAAMSTQVSALPESQPLQATSVELQAINSAALARARANATEALQKTINAWGGGDK